MKLGGMVLIREGQLLDYCWEESIASLLPVCDVVGVCVGSGGGDATEERARELAAREPKIILSVYPWPDPKGDADFYVNWIQYGRQHTPCDYILHLDADEVLHENSYETVRKLKDIGDKRFSCVFHRFNFWKDPQHLIPHGVCCGHEVVRMVPQNVWLPSDGYHPNGEEAVMMGITPPGPLEIFHYGFLRHTEAFFKKARALQGYFFDTYDPRLKDAEGDPKWMEKDGITGWEKDLLPFTGTHPALMKSWLEERGYKV